MLTTRSQYDYKSTKISTTHKAQSVQGGVSVWFVVGLHLYVESHAPYSLRCQCELVTAFRKCGSVGYILEDNTIRLVMTCGHIAVKDNAFAMSIDFSGWYNATRWNLACNPRCTVTSSAPGLQSCPKCKLYIDRVDACTFRLQVTIASPSLLPTCGHCIWYLCGSTISRL